MMSKKVTYSDIVNALAKKTGVSKQKSEEFVKALLNEVKEELKESGKASITNFGSFKVKEVAERQGKNPQTGDPITIPAHKRVSFSPYKSLRENVNAKYEHLESTLIEEEQNSVDEQAEDLKGEQETAESQSEPKADDKVAFDVNPFATETETEELDSDTEEDEGEKPETESEVENIGDSEETEEVEASEIKEVGDDEESEAALVASEASKEKNYTNLLASLAVLLLTIIAITSVWFLLDNGKENNAVTQNDVKVGTLANGQQAVQSHSTRSFESIKKEADDLEKRLNALQREQERLRAQENQRVERLADARESSSDIVSNDDNDSNNSASENESTVENYEVQEGEWYWVISDKLYGKPRFWPLLFKENHSVNEDPDKLFKQVSIKVPVMEGTAANPTKQDYKELAAATKMVAQAYQNAGKTDKANEYAKFARKWEQMGA